MSVEKPFTPKSLNASEYVLSLFEPLDNVAILLRNRLTSQVLQRITRVNTVAELEFQSWLKSRNAAGWDVFVGMNVECRGPQEVASSQPLFGGGISGHREEIVPTALHYLVGAGKD